MLELLLVILFSQFPSRPVHFIAPRNTPVKCIKGQICLNNSTIQIIK